MGSMVPLLRYHLIATSIFKIMIIHNGNETIELLTDDNSYSYEAVMGEDALTLYFSHPGYLSIPVGSWCEFYGKRYP